MVSAFSIKLVKDTNLSKKINEYILYFYEAESENSSGNKDVVSALSVKLVKDTKTKQENK